jgi:threonine/homoserine/homoserine lactone efflux protein
MKQQEALMPVRARDVRALAVAAAALASWAAGISGTASCQRAAYTTPRTSWGVPDLQGFWTNALNPKVALFFLAFVPQFISAEASNKALTFVLLGLLFNLNALPVNLAYALLAAWAGSRLQRWHGGLAWLQRLAGALFIGFGLKLALADPSTP